MALEKIIGVPRALIYYNYFPFLWGFFTHLGFEIVTSDPTGKKTVTEGSKLVVSETCLPIKVYVGHVLNLLEKGVKNIFVPSIQSIAPKIYNCSKIRGLPDLIRNIIKEDFTLIEATFDKSEKGLGLYEFLRATVEKFGIKDEAKIRAAQIAGFIVFNNFSVMMQQGIDYETSLKNAMEGKVIIPPPKSEKPVNVAIIAHGYNIFDKKVSMDIFKKLDKMNVGVFCPNNLADEQKKDGVINLETEVYWANELEMTGSAGYYLNNDKVDGVITITAFGCGPDSLMIERMTRKSKKFSKPILNLTIDEHTGEAGFITRLEAFCDMLLRRKKAVGSKEKLSDYELSSTGIAQL